jgi:hypothetical protein
MFLAQTPITAQVEHSNINNINLIAVLLVEDCKFAGTVNEEVMIWKV